MSFKNGHLTNSNAVVNIVHKIFLEKIIAIYRVSTGKKKVKI
jgi:hypothetical protein